MRSFLLFPLVAAAWCCKLVEIVGRKFIKLCIMLEYAVFLQLYVKASSNKVRFIETDWGYRVVSPEEFDDYVAKLEKVVKQQKENKTK